MELLDRAGDIVLRYSAILCDVWGVLHNGVDVYHEAATALQAYRGHGGRVILLSNSPRPWSSVRDQLDDLRAPRDAYDAIVTSGDATRSALQRRAGARIFHLGPERDRSLTEDLDLKLVPLKDADAVLCSGLYDDETETPDDYVGTLTKMHDRGMVMYCANPDKVVHRGERLIYCAGALAERYNAMGGRVVLAGKPHSPIYRLAFERLDELAGERVDRNAVLAIGDAVPTDLAGAAAAGLDCLFVSGGIHGAELGKRPDIPDPDRVQSFLETTMRQLPGLRLVGVISRLRW
jgi:HAD superfamily hydrolase (TIGR01459 family)